MESKKKEMNILFISSKKNWGGVVSLSNRLALKLKEKGSKTWVISNKKSSFTKNASKNISLIPRTFGMDYNPLMILYLIYFIKKYKINIIVTNIKKEIIVGGIAAKICQIPNIRLIGNERDFERFYLLKKYLVSHNILPCEYVKKNSLRNVSWLRSRDLSVIHLGLNYTAFNQKEILNEKKKLCISLDKTIIGVTGRLAKGKGVDFLIKSFSKIANRYPNTIILITGAGNQQETLEKLVNSLNLTNQVLFSGFTKNPLIRAALYDIAIMPSEYEAFPYVIIEYLSVGSAVIATDVGGTNEIIKSNENGFLIKNRNQHELIDKIQLLIENEELRKKFRKASIETIEKYFSEDIMIEKFITVFNRFTVQ
jgi:glycosyltransferase involved in cell wall biosynthesis